MTTKLLDANGISEAAELLRHGGLVAIPTETVYGLAANALDADAVAKIFTAKGRPQDNPLIVHIAEPEQVYDLVTDVPETAAQLMRAFWPGALTLVMNAAPCVPRVVTAGLSTVAVRCPSHTIARGILKAAGVPLAAPSANRSGLPSPTRASHVIDDMNGRIAAVLDGGECSIGVESTVIDVSRGEPCLLRLGGVLKADLERVLGTDLSIDIHSDKPRSPGQKYRHYAPRAALTVVSAENADTIPRNSLTLCPLEYAQMFSSPIVYGRLSEPESLARGLFAALREADSREPSAIFAVYPDGEKYAAVRDRLFRAALPSGYKENTT